MRVRPSQRPYNLAYYRKNRDAEIARVSSRTQATLAWLRDLRRVPCADCGRTVAPYVMDFDHRDPAQKSFSLAAEKVLLKNRGLLEAEVAKCDIVCANCHRVRTARQAAAGLIGSGFKFGGPPANDRVRRKRESWHRRRREQMDLLRRLRELPCAGCGETFPICVMEFDHRVGVAKRGLVSQMAGRVKIATLLDEIAKCDVVCSNCHRIRTYERRQVPTIKTGTLAAGVL